MTILKANLPVSYVEKKSDYGWELQYSQTCIKPTCTKRSLTPEKKIPKMISLDYFKIDMF